MAIAFPLALSSIIFWLRVLPLFSSSVPSSEPSSEDDEMDIESRDWEVLRLGSFRLKSCADGRGVGLNNYAVRSVIPLWTKEEKSKWKGIVKWWQLYRLSPPRPPCFLPRYCDGLHPNEQLEWRTTSSWQCGTKRHSGFRDHFHENIKSGCVIMGRVRTGMEVYFQDGGERNQRPHVKGNKE